MCKLKLRHLGYSLTLFVLKVLYDEKKSLFTVTSRVEYMKPELTWIQNLASGYKTWIGNKRYPHHTPHVRDYNEARPAIAVVNLYNTMAVTMSRCSRAIFCYLTSPKCKFNILLWPKIIIIYWDKQSLNKLIVYTSGRPLSLWPWKQCLHKSFILCSNILSKI